MKNFLFALFSAAILLSSCGGSGSAFASKGKKAALEVIHDFETSGPEALKQGLMKYGDTLEGQDYLDFYETLQEAGIL